jgi:hypothetical protein
VLVLAAIVKIGCVNFFAIPGFADML